LGRQIEFFFGDKDEASFLDFIYGNDYLIMDRKGNFLSKENAQISIELSFFITFNGSQIEKNGEFIDQYSSEIIQNSRCKFWVDDILSHGRIWTQLKYWNSDNEYVEKNSQLNQTYNVLLKWIKKNTRRSICKYYYIGEQAYEQYRQGKWNMSTGAKSFIEFEV